jgi:hypothetical protein
MEGTGCGSALAAGCRGRPSYDSPGPADRGPGLFDFVSAGAVPMWNQSLVSPDPVMISWKASGTLVVEHFPADRA